MDNEDYRYKHLPLTPAVIEFLIRELFSGQLVERQTIVDEVLRSHLARGGKKADVQSVIGSFKRALKDLKRKGLAENPSLGHWRIRAGESAPTVGDHADTIQDFSHDEILDYPIPEEFSESKPIIDLEIGSGAGAIYVYYLPTYRQQAEQREEDVWPCKIGRTDRDPLERILAQAATALPERPHIALVLRTCLPLAWEAALHGVLTLRGLKIKDSPGSEWFLTSPDATLSLIEVFDPTVITSRESKGSQGTR